MSNSFEQYIGDGSTRTFGIPFSYLSRDHISVSVDGNLSSFVFLTDASIQTPSAPANGTTVEVRRTTPIDEAIVSFKDGSTLGQRDLDRAVEQLLYVVQEAQDAVTSQISLDASGTWDAGNRRISNLNPGTVAGEAVTFEQLQSWVDTLTTLNTQSSSSASQAAASEVAAAASAASAASVAAEAQAQNVSAGDSLPVPLDFSSATKWNNDPFGIFRVPKGSDAITQLFDGTHVVRFSAQSGDSFQSFFQGDDSLFPVTPGEWFSASVQIASSGNPSDLIRLGVGWYDQSKALLRTDFVAIEGSSSTNNQKVQVISGQSVAPFGSAYCGIFITRNGTETGSSLWYAGYPTLSRLHDRIVSTISDLKALPTFSLKVGETVRTRGFDTAEDGYGGEYELIASTPGLQVDGVIMASNTAGFGWRRSELVHTGMIPITWAGVKKGSYSSFNTGAASTNRTRFQSLLNYASDLLGNWLSSGADVNRYGIYIPAGVYDFTGAALEVGESVSISGAGPLTSILRTDGAVNDNFIEFLGNLDGESFGASTVIQGFGVRRFTNDTSSLARGLYWNNMVRNCVMRDIAVYGFGNNISFTNVWEIELDNVWSEAGRLSNFVSFGGQINSVTMRGCRFDGVREVGSANVVIEDTTGSARNITLQGCAIQRSQGIALRLNGIRSARISDCQFEGNDRVNSSSPNIWVDGPNVSNLIIDGNYFTSAGGLGFSSGRAINIRNTVLAGAQVQISNNSVASGPDGTFTQFIDIDTTNALTLFDWGNISAASSTIPGNVTVRSI